MKVGDLVRYIDEAHDREEQGIIVDGPKHALGRDPLPSQWQVVWTVAGTKGWWNEGFLEVISELA